MRAIEDSSNSVLVRRIKRMDRLYMLAAKELENRLRRYPANFSDRQLIDLTTGALKLQMSFQRQADTPVKPEVKNFIQFVTNPGLPPERQRELLLDGIRTMEAHGADARDLRDALVNLVGEEEAGKLLAVPMEVNGARALESAE